MKKVTLNEIMGSSGQKGKAKNLSLDDLGELLGERMPKLEFSPVGRLRLTTALRNRFGDSYRNLPGIEDVLKEFDDHARFNVKLMEMKQIKPKGR
jgi:hypothetical protein